MALITHNISSMNDGLGDQLRTAFGNQNTMNSELYTETGKLRTDLVAASTGATGKSIVPTSPAPTGTGIQSYTATQAGTYTNYGGVVVNANSFAIISRDAAGAFSISQTPLDISGKVNVSDIINNLTSTDTTKPLSAAQGKILNENFSGYLAYNTKNGDFVIKDSSGNVAFFITADREVIFDLSDDHKEQIKSLLVGNYVAGKEFQVKDSSGNIGLVLDENGELDFSTLGVAAIEFIKNLITPLIPAAPVTPELISKSNSAIKLTFNFADINHIINYGQSLAVGQTESVLSSEPFYGNILTFGGSVLTSPYSENYPANLTSFTPLFERSYTPNANLKETPTTGICEKFYKDILASRFSYKKGLKVLGSAPGQGATKIAELSKGTAFYDRVIADVNAGKNVSTGLGKTYKCYAVTFTQGESDYLWNTAKNIYQPLLKQLSIDLNNDIKAITGQTEEIRFIIYQTATVNNYVATPTIALAQYELAIADDNIIEMATPMHFMEYNDTFHLNSNSSKLMGVYYGKALGSDKKFKPVYPIGHLIKTNNIELTFNVPEKPLEFEAIATTSTILNQGFEVIKASVNILTSVSIMSDGITVKLTCSESPTGSEIRYGFQKAVTTANTRSMGFLRDSEGLYNQHRISGIDYRLNNWCPVLTYNI